MKRYNQQETAAIIRKDIKLAFPGEKFNITCQRGSMCYGVNVRWTDGPALDDVKKFLSYYSCRKWDSHEDIYRYNTVRYQGEDADFSGVPDPYRTVSEDVYSHACELVGVTYEEYLVAQFTGHVRREVHSLIGKTHATDLLATNPEDYQQQQAENWAEEDARYQAQAAEPQEVTVQEVSEVDQAAQAVAEAAAALVAAQARLEALKRPTCKPTAASWQTVGYNRPSTLLN